MNGYQEETIHGVPISTWQSWSDHTQELWLEEYYISQEQATYYQTNGDNNNGGILQVIAETTYDVLDPFFGEGEVFEDVAAKVEEGEILEAGLEVIDTVFVEPVVEYTEEKVEDIIDYIEEPLEELKETGEKYILYGVGALALILLLR